MASAIINAKKEKRWPWRHLLFLFLLGRIQPEIIQTAKYVKTASNIDVMVIAASGSMARSRKSRKLTVNPSPTIAAVRSQVVAVDTNSCNSCGNGIDWPKT